MTTHPTADVEADELYARDAHDEQHDRIVVSDPPTPVIAAAEPREPRTTVHALLTQAHALLGRAAQVALDTPQDGLAPAARAARINSLNGRLAGLIREAKDNHA